MRVTLDRVGKGSDGAILEPVSAVLETGRVSVIPCDTDQGPSVLSLILAGRMAVASGEIHADSGHSRRRLRRATALIDTPAVCEPAPTVPLRTVVAEELLFARRRSDPRAVRRWLAEHGLERLGDHAMMHVPGMTRIRVLVELALLRPGIEALVLTSPERFGADLSVLAEYALEVARRGIAVALVVGSTSARILDAELASLAAAGAAPAAEPEPAAALAISGSPDQTVSAPAVQPPQAARPSRSPFDAPRAAD